MFPLARNQNPISRLRRPVLRAGISGACLKEAEIIEDEKDGQDEIRHHAEQHDKVKGGCVSFFLFGCVHNASPLNGPLRLLESGPILTRIYQKSSGF